MMDQEALGTKLKEARLNKSISQEQAAEALALPRTAIVHIESGKRSVNTVELIQLAKLYERPIIHFFVEKQPQEEDALVAFNRLTGTSLPPDYESEVKRCFELCHEGVLLTRILDRHAKTSPPEYSLPEPRNYADAVEQGQIVAEQERLRIGQPTSPIPDMADFIAAQGIWASGARLPDEMSGLFLAHPILGLAILVNYDHVRGRKRFSYAHEYGHALMDRKNGASTTRRANASDLIEKRANAFAASFLMPKQGVEAFLSSLSKGAPSRKYFSVYDVATEGEIEAEVRTKAEEQQIQCPDAALLAVHYGVTYLTAAYRLSDLNFINRKELTSLLEKQEAAQALLTALKKWQEIAAKGENDRELANQILPLAVEAFRREEISQGRFLEITKKLGISEGRKLLELEC
jgi:Zn-dependent peptidase ImmA (M78 family)/transcriptional regulator with XRE-family HTH domain